jgi:hypothetical protein
MLSIDEIIQLSTHFALLYQNTEITQHSATMTSTSSTEPFDAAGKHILWPEEEPSEQPVLRPVATAPVEENEKSGETPEEESQRKREFDKFVKRFLKVDNVGEVFSENGKETEGMKAEEKAVSL